MIPNAVGVKENHRFSGQDANLSNGILNDLIDYARSVQTLSHKFFSKNIPVTLMKELQGELGAIKNDKDIDGQQRMNEIMDIITSFHEKCTSKQIHDKHVLSFLEDTRFLKNSVIEFDGTFAYKGNTLVIDGKQIPHGYGKMESSPGLNGIVSKCEGRFFRGAPAETKYTYSNQSSWEGHVRKESLKPHGRGKYISPTGDCYTGYANNGVPDGLGSWKIKWTDNTWALLSGQWENGTLRKGGLQIINNEDQVIIEGKYDSDTKDNLTNSTIDNLLKKLTSITYRLKTR